MKKIYLIRKGISLDQLSDLIDFLNNYNTGQYYKVMYQDPESLSEMKESMKKCDFIFLFLGNDISKSKYVEEEILFASRSGSRLSVFTLDEKNFPHGTVSGIPSPWRMYVGTILKATKSNLLYKTHKIGFLYP